MQWEGCGWEGRGICARGGGHLCKGRGVGARGQVLVRGGVLVHGGVLVQGGGSLVQGDGGTSLVTPGDPMTSR